MDYLFELSPWSWLDPKWKDHLEIDLIIFIFCFAHPLCLCILITLLSTPCSSKRCLYYCWPLTHNWSLFILGMHQNIHLCLLSFHHHTLMRLSHRNPHILLNILLQSVDIQQSACEWVDYGGWCWACVCLCCAVWSTAITI